MLTSPTRQDSTSTSRATNRLAGIDGLRGFAAVWVMLFHIYAVSQAHFLHIPGVDAFFRKGYTGVSLFLVLSGFCLYVPFAGGRTEKFKTGEFFRRRARRLVPTYYAALLFAVVLSILGASWLGFEAVGPAQLAWQVLTHLTFTQTLFPSTYFGLNPSLWSLALEWHLYIGLPLLILGVRRFGLAYTVAAVFLWNVIYGVGLAVASRAGLIPAHSMAAVTLLPNQLFGRWAEFALGMVAAELYVSGRLSKWTRPLKWWMLVIIAVVSAAIVKAGVLRVPVVMVKGLLFGAAVANLNLNPIMLGTIYFVLVSLVLARNNAISRLFSWSPLVKIGTMSYSLYLTHEPLVRALGYLVRRYTPQQRFTLLIGAVPLIFGVAWCLFMLVERYSLRPAQPNAHGWPGASVGGELWRRTRQGLRRLRAPALSAPEAE